MSANTMAARPNTAWVSLRSHDTGPRNCACCFDRMLCRWRSVGAVARLGIYRERSTVTPHQKHSTALLDHACSLLDDAHEVWRRTIASIPRNKNLGGKESGETVGWNLINGS